MLSGCSLVCVLVLLFDCVVCLVGWVWRWCLYYLFVLFVLLGVMIYVECLYVVYDMVFGCLRCLVLVCCCSFGRCVAC